MTGSIRREHASVNGIRRQLGTGWRTVWESIKPLLQAAEQDPTRFDDVTILGVDERGPMFRSRVEAEQILDSFASCAIPEVARLGRTLRTWRREFLGYFDTGGARQRRHRRFNGLIELHRRIGRGFHNRDNYRLRMLLIGGGLLPCTTLNGEEPVFVRR